MPHAELPAYREGFFQKFLGDLPGSPTRDALAQQQPTNTPFELMGEYVQYAGAAIQPIQGGSITPQFAIRTESSGAAQTFVLAWVVERLDVKTDSKETMARILADFRKPTASGSEKEGALTSELATQWAEALSQTDVQQALATNLGSLTARPSGLPEGDLDQLKTLLLHFGTYKPNGDYYEKGPVAEGQFPQGVSAAYLASDTGNVAEVRVHRDNFYCSALVSERLWNPQAPVSRFRQLVFRIEDFGQDSPDRWRLVLLHTVSVTREGSAPFNRFIIFHAPVGLGLDVPDPARQTLGPSTASFLEQLPDLTSSLAASLSNPDIPLVGTEQAPIVLLIGAVTEDFPRSALPEGVISDGEGAVRTFRCPPAHVMALATRPDIRELTLSTPVWPDMTDAQRELNMAGRTFPAGVTAANTGQGVVVGVVDTGIDGSHPAFLGRQDDATKTRIFSVWNMWETGGDSPFRRSGSQDVYRSMNFGKEYLGYDEIVTCSDPDSHGTHVSGIAAGRPVGTWPGGIAPAATLVVVGLGNSGFVNDIMLGVKYCFQKATQLGLPCVVNISLGTERHSHDGTDPLSIGLTQLVSSNFVPATGLGTLVNVMPAYIGGRIICGAAGNLRGTNLHWQATIPGGGQVSVLYRPFGRGATASAVDDGITFWAYNEEGTTARLLISARDSTNAVLATPEIGLRGSGGAISTTFPGGLRVNIHNGPERPNNGHFNPEIYWQRPAPPPPPAAPLATTIWVVRIRNRATSPCVIHGFASFREWRGGFVFANAQTTPLLGFNYTAADMALFESHKVHTPGNAMGVIGVAAYTSRPGLPTAVGDIAPFSSSGPLRAAGPGRRAVDVAAPGYAINSTMPGGGFGDKQGTSMACPMVTGLVAALLQLDTTLNTGQILNRLEIASSRRATDNAVDWGLGRVDASKFIRI